MCGIFGYLGKKQNAVLAVHEGLKRLNYRGYDSWGIGALHNESLKVEKNNGKIGDAVVKLPACSVAIGHTRWATHGKVTSVNAHPHASSDGSFILAQNGIMENYESVKKALLKKGYVFQSETDTEVIVRFVEDNLKQCETFYEAVRKTFLNLEGRNTIIILSKDGSIIAARNGSPLVIGTTKNFSEIYFSSDTLSFAPFVDNMIVLENQEMAIARPSAVTVKNLVTDENVSLRLEKITIVDDKVDKQGYEHFMLKEIYDSPSVVCRLTKQDRTQYDALSIAIKKARNVFTIGSGTAGVAAAQTAYYLRKFGKISADSLIGAEAEEYLDFLQNRDLIIAPSQSGETADVLKILEPAKSKGVKIASFVNMPGSLMTRLSDYKFMAEAGPEICVMSTKVFISQIAWGYLLAKTVANDYENGVNNLKLLAFEMEKFLNNAANHLALKKLAKQLAQHKNLFLLSKEQNLQIIKEGMIKITEGSYIYAHAVSSGDIKHYAITLMEKGVQVIFVFSNDGAKKNIINAVNEIKARGATVIGMGPSPEAIFDEFFQIPDTGETSAVMNAVPLQLLAYYMALKLGNNIDKPRNIAKSVTVT